MSCGRLASSARDPWRWCRASGVPRRGRGVGARKGRRGEGSFMGLEAPSRRMGRLQNGGRLIGTAAGPGADQATFSVRFRTAPSHERTRGGFRTSSLPASIPLSPKGNLYPELAGTRIDGYPSVEECSLEGEAFHERYLGRHQAGGENARQASGVHRRRGDHPGPRHRRQHRDLQRGQRPDVPAAAGSRGGEAGRPHRDRGGQFRFPTPSPTPTSSTTGRWTRSSPTPRCSYPTSSG